MRRVLIIFVLCLLASSSLAYASEIPTHTVERGGSPDRRASNIELRGVSFDSENNWVFTYGEGSSADWKGSATLPSSLRSQLDDLADSNTSVQQVEFTPSDAWAVVIDFHNDLNYFELSSAFPRDARARLTSLANDSGDVASIHFSSTGGWVILYYDVVERVYGYWQKGIPSTLATKLKELTDRGSIINYVTFDPRGNNWLVIFDSYGYSASGMPSALVDELRNINRQSYTIKSVELDFDGGWVIVYGVNAWIAEDVPTTLLTALRGVTG